MRSADAINSCRNPKNMEPSVVIRSETGGALRQGSHGLGVAPLRAYPDMPTRPLRLRYARQAQTRVRLYHAANLSCRLVPGSRNLKTLSRDDRGSCKVLHCRSGPVWDAPPSITLHRQPGHTGRAIRMLVYSTCSRKQPTSVARQPRPRHLRILAHCDVPPAWPPPIRQRPTCHRTAEEKARGTRQHTSRKKTSPKSV